jgi:hypothetical protein
MCCVGENGEEATCEAGGHEFESTRTRIFHVKNRVTCYVTCACVKTSGGFKYLFDAGVPPLVPVRSPGTKGPPLLSLIISPGWI